jgi:small subunit ribosomal protein S17
MEEQERNKRKVKKGRVIANKMQKTVVVEIERTLRHPQYGKVIKQKKKLYAHNDLSPLEIGQEVTVVETRPLSKLKRWRVVAA